MLLGWPLTSVPWSSLQLTLTVCRLSTSSVPFPSPLLSVSCAVLGSLNMADFDVPIIWNILAFVLIEDLVVSWRPASRLLRSLVDEELNGRISSVLSW